MLQTELVQIGTGGVLILNTALLLRLAYIAGTWGERLLNFEHRIQRLEAKECPHADCPLKAHLDLGIEER